MVLGCTFKVVCSRIGFFYMRGIALRESGLWLYRPRRRTCWRAEEISCERAVAPGFQSGVFNLGVCFKCSLFGSSRGCQRSLVDFDSNLVLLPVLKHGPRSATNKRGFWCYKPEARNESDKGAKSRKKALQHPPHSSSLFEREMRARVCLMRPERQ